ncbi:MAG: REP-associated tyrosine transposase [Opitutaceae bacterium]
MTSSQIRQSFLDFFRARQHTIVPSSSLMPDSPGLLFTNAGMNQFVPIFLNERRPDVSKWAGAIPGSDTRAADTQKCIRAGGKHNDLEDVGWDTYHHTMFEMLGNWSFGDYFKSESLTWGWELLTKVWGIPAKRLFATVYSPDKSKGDPAGFDQEAYDIWAGLFRDAGLDPDIHIVNGNKKDNFWMMGDTGPCGPCSEVHFNLLPSGDEKAGRDLVNAGSPRCIEIWNHVFIQFNAGADGSFSPLPARHVDTGMGFERVAGIYATTTGFTDFAPEPSNYNADVFTSLFDVIAQLSGKSFAGTVPMKREGLSEQEKTDIAFRVLADHARTVSCAIADGIIPGNDGRNYVIRRILRRGILYGRKDLGLGVGFFEKLVPAVAASLGDVFPELKQQQPTIERIVRSEEESFGRMLDRGLARFHQVITTLTGPGSARVPRAAPGVSPDASRDIHYAKRNLPHFERPWGKYHITFSTHERRRLSDAAREIVVDSLLHGERAGRYVLFAAVVMPDHVHALLEPQPVDRSGQEPTKFHPLSKILQSIKSFTAHAINKAENASGHVWGKETFDRLIRNEGDLQEKYRYIIDNPRKAELTNSAGEYDFLIPGPGSARVPRAAPGVSPDASEGVRRDAEHSPRDAGAPRTEISGADAFELYDTYGFPLDMTQLLAAERGITVDVAGFEAEMEKQRERGRAAQKKEVITVSEGGAGGGEATLFVGYTLHPAPWVEGRIVDVVSTDADAFLVFDQSPFYAEMGGQVGDRGHASIDGVSFEMVDTIKDKAGRFLHKIAPAQREQLLAITPLIGVSATLGVEPAFRREVQRHHTGTHLLHWALRKVLGTHVRQSGSAVHRDSLRFDFAHFEQVKPEQLREVERLVNERILDNAPVSAREVPYAEVSGRKDVMQFFGDKYGGRVRVVQIGGEPGALDGYSMELCGGTHVSTTGEIGLLKITVESAIAAGTRRIEAVAGEAAYRLVSSHEDELRALGQKLNVTLVDLPKRVDTLLAQRDELEQRLKAFEQKAAAGLADELVAKTTERDGFKRVVATVETPDPNALRQLGAQILAKLGEGVVVLGAVFGAEKVSVVALCSPAAIKSGLAAGRIVSEACAKLGGKGGGKPDFAMGGGKDAASLEGALAALR